MEIDIEQQRSLQEANQNKTDAETFLQQTQDQSQRKLILSYVFFQILLGPVGDALARAMPYEMLVPRCEGTPSVLSCGSCRMVMESNHLHIYTVISSFPEIFVEGPLARSMLVSHPAMGRNKPVCLARCASFRC